MKTRWRWRVPACYPPGMRITQPEDNPLGGTTGNSPPVEKAADRWLAIFAALAFVALALALWNSFGTRIFIEMAAGFWALCF